VRDEAGRDSDVDIGVLCDGAWDPVALFDGLDRLRDSMVLDAVVLNLLRACEMAIDAACREVLQRRRANS
jgi:predicted nucleotidyltransferase